MLLGWINTTSSTSTTTATTTTVATITATATTFANVTAVLKGPSRSQICQLQPAATETGRYRDPSHWERIYQIWETYCTENECHLLSDSKADTYETSVIQKKGHRHRRFWIDPIDEHCRIVA